jgi:hypothetical protein
MERDRPTKSPTNSTGAVATNAADRSATRLNLFGPPPLIEGEDPAAYDDLLVRISAAVNPADILEDIWVRDVVDFTWEIFSLRRLKANLMTATEYRGIRAVLEPIIDFDDADTLATKWAARNPDAIKRVNNILDSAGLTMDAVIAQTLFQNLDFVERIERMITVKESSRNAVLCEIDRHRATLANTLRGTVHQLEHGEIPAVDDTQSAEGKNAA